MILAAGVVCMLMTAVLWPILRRLYAPTEAKHADLDPREARSAQRRHPVLTDHVSLSGDARRVLNRRAEKDLLCRAIEEDINAEDWDAAMVLCRELADRFGYRVEAEEFRAKIDSYRGEVQERKVADSIARLDGLIIQRRWTWPSARPPASSARIPIPTASRPCVERVEQARAVYKADLERRFLDAAQNEHFDEAMEFLKELDGYLTEHEAEPFREVARGVIGKARENLGAQFKVAVRDKQWPRPPSSAGASSTSSPTRAWRRKSASCWTASCSGPTARRRAPEQQSGKEAQHTVDRASRPGVGSQEAEEICFRSISLRAREPVNFSPLCFFLAFSDSFGGTTVQKMQKPL